MTKAKILPLSALDTACEEQLAKVRAEWPDGIPLTTESANRAIALDLDIDWAANHILSLPAWAEYDHLQDSALADYKRVTDSAWADYRRVAAALAEYDYVTDSALADYKRVTDSAEADYKRVMAVALAEILLRSDVAVEDKR